MAGNAASDAAGHAAGDDSLARLSGALDHLIASGTRLPLTGTVLERDLRAIGEGMAALRERLERFATGWKKVAE
ncbi:MAG TPA: hypothetical protein VGS80_18620 [Ktedonobacterales bacterium]|nr:hypothetical protein [Ktedonobacterales bacterium]